MAMPTYTWLFSESPAVQGLFKMGLVKLVGLAFGGQWEKRQAAVCTLGSWACLKERAGARAPGIWTRQGWSLETCSEGGHNLGAPRLIQASCSLCQAPSMGTSVLGQS